MPRPNIYSDKRHARVYLHWCALPAWRHMRPNARLLLVYMLMEFLPGTNGRLEWSLTKVQGTLNCSRATASACLTDLEKCGWISVSRIGHFAGSRQPSLYRLNMYDCDGLPPSRAFEFWNGPNATGRKRNLTGQNKTADRFQRKPEQVSIETARPKNGTFRAGGDKDNSLNDPNGLHDANDPLGVALGKLSTKILLAARAKRVAS